jgi:hypothetical protein
MPVKQEFRYSTVDNSGPPLIINEWVDTLTAEEQKKFKQAELRQRRYRQDAIDRVAIWYCCQVNLLAQKMVILTCGRMRKQPNTTKTGTPNGWSFGTGILLNARLKWK